MMSGALVVSDACCAALSLLLVITLTSSMNALISPRVWVLLLRGDCAPERIHRAV
jgi:hypothetical protein